MTLLFWALCTAIFLVLPSEITPYVLGDGFSAMHMLGWLTAPFAHSGWDHFIGNLLYGLPLMAVVESVGSWRLWLRTFAVGVFTCGTLAGMMRIMAPIVGASGIINAFSVVCFYVTLRARLPWTARLVSGFYLAWVLCNVWGNFVAHSQIISYHGGGVLAGLIVCWQIRKQ